MSRTIGFMAPLPLLLAGCGGLPGGEAFTAGLGTGLVVAPAQVVVSEAPAEVYTRVARQVYACWLAAEPPLLPGQQFYAEAEAGGSGDARIALHTPAADNKRGQRNYAITMRRSPEGTRVETEAPHIDDAERRETMNRAVMAWARGETSCNAGDLPAASDASLLTAAQTEADARAQDGEPPLPVRRPKQPSAATAKHTASATTAGKPGRASLRGSSVGAAPAVQQSQPAPAREAAAVTAADAGAKAEARGDAATPQLEAAANVNAPADAAAAPVKLPAEHKFLQSEPSFSRR